MARFVILRGIPASGKSTYAKTLVEQGFKRVNKDELREQLYGGFKSANEKVVNATALKRIEEYLEAGLDVVSDNTNISGDFVIKQFEIAKRLGIVPEVKTFEISTEEAIKRDKLRKKPVGTMAIRHMAKMLRTTPLPIVEPSTAVSPAVSGLPMAIIVDLDGTVADTKERAKVASTKENYPSRKWWDVFFDPLLVRLDTPMGDSAKVLQEMSNKYTVIYLTGRRVNMKSATLEWLYKNGYPVGELILRPIGVKSVDFKSMALNELKGRYQLVYAFDDDDDNLRMFKEFGIPNIVKVTGPETWARTFSAPEPVVTALKIVGAVFATGVLVGAVAEVVKSRSG